MPSSLSYRRLRAVKHDGGLLSYPPPTAWAESTWQNRQLVDGYDFRLQDRSFQSLRAQARQDLVRLALAYTRQYVDTDEVDPAGPLVVSGHQPELFHPGVWAKNFAAHQLARRLGGAAIHVIIDNDLMRRHTVNVPSGSLRAPRVVVEPFDRFLPPQPFECRHLVDPGTFRSFGNRLAQHLNHFFRDEVVVTPMWRYAQEAMASAQTVGQVLSRARHRLESDWGVRSLEIPLSHLCETFAFRWYAADLLLRGDRVWSEMNRRLAEYRRVHRIRTAAQPMPDLRREAGWTEAPFWFWKHDAPTRRPLWWRPSAGRLEIGQPAGSLGTAQDTADGLVELFTSLSGQGYCIRPRALSNTMFLRLFLTDLFIHGIGGAKYDQITDVLCEDLYAARAAPQFAVLSQTTLLPVAYPLVGHPEIVAQKVRLREMHFHPERFLAGDSPNNQVSNWVNRKMASVCPAGPDGLTRRERHLRIEEANAALRRFLQEKQAEQQKEWHDLLARAAVSKVWGSREWSSLLFPVGFLRRRLLDLPIAGG